MHALIRHQGDWLRFSDPLDLLIARRADQVLPCLKELERGDGWAVGFLCYEAASALRPRLATHPARASLPLLCFGRFAPPRIIKRPSGGGYRLGTWTPSINHPDYLNTIARINAYLGTGDSYQVNFTFQLRAPFTGDPAGLFRDLVNAQGCAQGAYLDLGDVAICSASPELFFDYRDGLLTARPMKGTRARGLTLADDREQAASLRTSTKDLAENRMILDMMRHDIGSIAEIGSVRVTRPFHIEKYPTLWQMTSTVSGRTQAGLARIFQALFPCASITGAPKVRTMEIIRALEPEARGIYTGAIGVIEPGGQARFHVAIRTAVVERPRDHNQPGTVEYGVGGGILWDSDPASEYREALTKAAILTRKHVDFRLLETLLWDEAGIYLLRAHLRRLRDSARYFDFRCDIRHIQDALCGLDPDGPRARIRLLVDASGAFEMQILPLTCSPEPVDLALAPLPVDSRDVFLYHKTTNRAVYEQARASCPQATDVLLHNERGELTETCTANLVFLLDDRRVTPRLDSGLLAGTERARLLAGGEIAEARVTLADLPRIQALWLINSVQKCRRARLVSAACATPDTPLSKRL